MQRSLKIGIDARLVTYRRGMGNFTYNLLKELAKLSTDHEYLLYVDDPAALPLLPTAPHFSAKVLSPKFYPIWEQIILPLQVAKDRLDVLHCPANTAPLQLRPNTKLILTIHDVMYLMPPQTIPLSPSRYQQLGRFYRRHIVPSASRRATVINTVSEQSRLDIETYLGKVRASVIVTHEAADPAFQMLPNSVQLAAIRTKYGLSKRVLLALGGIDPRKNTKRILESFVRFQQRLPGIFQLIIVGMPLDAQSSYRKLVHTLDAAASVVFTEFVPERDLIALYNIAELFLYPSLYEGFGLPVLEAMACGTPVLTSSVGSIPEVAGSAALFVDPYSIEAIEAGMSQILTDSIFAQQLQVAGLARAKLFSWQTVAQEMIRLYENATKN